MTLTGVGLGTLVLVTGTVLAQSRPPTSGEGDPAPAAPHSAPSVQPVAGLAEALPTPPATTQRMSVADNEAQGNTQSGGISDLVANANGDQAISSDGRWVAFVSTSANLTPGTTQPPGRLYLRDRLNGTTIAIPWFADAAWPAGITAAEPTISADGGAVAFTAIVSGSGVVGGIRGPTGPTPYVVVWDRATNALTLVSKDDAGTAVPGFQPSISGDGRYVAYTRWAPIATPAPTPSDTTPPVMSNLVAENSLKCISQGGSMPISVSATDPDPGVNGVILSYTPVNGFTTNVPMTFNGGTGKWEGVIASSPGWTSSNDGFISYYVRGYDFNGNYSSPFFPPDAERVYYSHAGCLF